MNIATVRLYCGKSGKLGYYNLQELGLAKALVSQKDGVQVYIMILDNKIKKIKEESIFQNITIIYIPTKKIGIHGFFNCNILKKYKIDVVHLQSDNQVYAPNVMKFCKKNNIECYNYVGTFYSDSSNTIKRKLMNVISNRNAEFYKKFTTFSKTPAVQSQLEIKGVISKVVPVGLDIEIIPNIEESKEELRLRLGFPVGKKILIYVGRLEDYKKPFDAIELIKSLNDGCILIIIGNGSLRNSILSKIKKYGIENKVFYLESLLNKEIHEYYKLSDFFVNFNHKEIFGMSILEAMYQECIVIAKDAPGPSFIIEDGVSGFIVNSLEDIISLVNSAPSNIGKNAKDRIISKFNWTDSASTIYSTIKV